MFADRDDGRFEDAALLDRLAEAKLAAIGEEVAKDRVA